MLSGEELSLGKVLDADCALMDAAAVWRVGHEKLLENPEYFIDR